VVTWDADAAADARDYFINRATPEGLVSRWWMRCAPVGRQGQIRDRPGTLSAANQNLWMEYMKKRVAESFRS
jgi:rhamnose transport system permease protein